MNKKVRKREIGTGKTAPENAERLPLDDVDPRILDIAFHAVFAPRSIAGKYQWDGLMYVILNTMADLEKGIKKISFEEFMVAFSKTFEGITSENEGRLSVYFKAFAKRLEYLETHRTQTAADFAVDALQDAFMGLTSGQYHWGKEGFPTKGEVKQMAKASLGESGKNARKTGWTNLLRRLIWIGSRKVKLAGHQKRTWMRLRKPNANAVQFSRRRKKLTTTMIPSVFGTPLDLLGAQLFCESRRLS